MICVERDDQGRELSQCQQDFFKDSKIRDENGTLLTLYHGSSYEFDAFDISKIRANETDAFYNGFWFSSDPYTLPAWTRLVARYEVYLNVCNPAPLDVVRQTVREAKKDWEYIKTPDDKFFPDSRSLQDEVRYRLQAKGYDGIIHDWKPDVNAQELEETGKTVVSSARGTKYILQKDEKYGGLDLFLYDKDEPDHLGDHLTGYSDLEDYLSIQDRTVVCFRPEQIKAVDNRTPTLDPNFKHNEPEQEATMMEQDNSYVLIDSYGDKITVYPAINFYMSDNNLKVGLNHYDEDLEDVDSYCSLTINGDFPHAYLEAAVDTTFNGDRKLEFLVQNGFGEPTGKTMFYGGSSYPIFKFNEDKLRQIDPVTFDAYAKAHGIDKKPSLDDRIAGAQTKADTLQETKDRKEPER